MSFPLDYRGRVSWRSQTGVQSEQLQQEVLSHLAQALTDVKGSPQVQGGRVSFTGGVFRAVSNWNVLYPITEGFIEVQPEQDFYVISYELNFKQILVMASVIAGVLFLMSAVVGQAPVVAVFFLCSFVWLAIFGMNYVRAMATFPGFITRALKSL